MAASETVIANIALSHLGVGKEIASLDENSETARAINRFYEEARDMVLRAFKWPFAFTTADLALVEEDPTDEWLFSYEHPTDCLMVHKIQSGTRNDTRQSRVPYRIANGDGSRVIYTDVEEAVIEYTARIDDPLMYSPDFTMALTYLLASFVAPRVVGGSDMFKLSERCRQMYVMEIQRAAANAANEEQAEELVDSEFIRGRE